MERLELSQQQSRQNLNLVRLPIPPHPRIIYCGIVKLRESFIVQKNTERHPIQIFIK